MTRSPGPPAEATLTRGEWGYCAPLPRPLYHPPGSPLSFSLFIFLLSWGYLTPPSFLSPHSSSFKQVISLLSSLLPPLSSLATFPLPSVLSLLPKGVLSDRLSPFSISFGHTEQCQLRFSKTNLTRTSYLPWKSSQGKENIIGLTCLVALEIDRVALWSGVGRGGKERSAFMWAGWKGSM